MSTLQLALDALTCAGSHDECQSLERCAIEALRAALEAPSTATPPFPPSIIDHLQYMACDTFHDGDGNDISGDAKKALEWVESANSRADACAQQARREALEAVENEAIEGVPGAEGDEGYNMAIKHCAAAIRALGEAGK